MSQLNIYLFGASRFEHQDGPIHIPRRKATALLAYLAATGQAHSRDYLATMFWPEHDQSKARANLRRELSRIKTTLNQDLFTSDREQVVLHPEVEWWLDIAEFKSRLAAAQELLSDQPGVSGAEDISSIIEEIQKCVALYKGEFMAGFSLPDCPQFDEWQFFERESLNRLLFDALQHLIRWKIVLGEYEEAIPAARQVISLDDVSEPAHRQLMQLYAWSGQRGAAIRQYKLCVNLLKAEIGVEPEEETTRLFEAIQSNQLALPDIDVLRQETPWISAQEKPGYIREDQDWEPGAPIDLAVQATPFIGRELEKDQLQKLLIDEPPNRLISVIGPGGVGKTRLVLESVQGLQESFTDGIFIIPLAALSSADQIVPWIAEQLNFRFHAATGQKNQLYEFMGNKQLLLVMDNFEHLVSGSPLVADLLQNLPDIKVLVTSRLRLNLASEVVFPLRGMNYPDLTVEDIPGESFSTNEAITLLVESARRVQPDFKLGPRDLEAAARLCQLVEGIPLAIILAASWLELLSLEEIIQEVSQNLDFLESQAVDIPDRQRSLRAVFNASWDALEAQEQIALKSLAIFQGSFTGQAALAVTKTSIQVLLGLIQKAWLQRNQNGRYQIHELQRQYAFEKLRTNPSAWDAACQEHAVYYTSWLEKINQDMRGSGQANAFTEIASELTNLQIAWSFFVAGKQFEILVRKFLHPIYRYCEARIKSALVLGLVDDALQVLEDESLPPENSDYRNILLIVQASFYSKGDSIRLDRYDIMIPPANQENIPRVGSQVNTPEELRNLGIWASLFAYLFGRFVDSQTGADHLRQMIQEYRQNEQRWELAVSLELLGSLNLAVSLNTKQSGNNLEEAGNALNEALLLFERLGDLREYSYTLLLLGGYHAYLQNWDEAISKWQEAQAKFDQIGDTITSLHWLLGDLLFKIGDYDRAFKYYQRIRNKYLQRGQKRIAAYALSFESMQALRYSDIQHARDTREESLLLSQGVDDQFGEAWSTWEMGEIERVAGNYKEALRWFENARLLFTNVNESNGLIFYHRGLGDIALAERAYSQAYAQFRQSYKHAENLRFNWGAAYALAGMGRAESAQQNFEAAIKHLSKSLQSVNSIEDAGLALLVLFSCANLYAARDEIEQAAEISILVAGHFATWMEIKKLASNLILKLGSSFSIQLDAEDIETDQNIIWQQIHRLLEKDFKPALFP